LIGASVGLLVGQQAQYGLPHRLIRRLGQHLLVEDEILYVDIAVDVRAHRQTSLVQSNSATHLSTTKGTRTDRQHGHHGRDTSGRPELYCSDCSK